MTEEIKKIEIENTTPQEPPEVQVKEIVVNKKKILFSVF